jgi:hypothetical protein
MNNFFVHKTPLSGRIVMHRFPSWLVAFSLYLSGIIFMPADTAAHCDTYSGPVIVAAKKALEKGDVTSILKWVKKEDEAQIKAAFKKTLAVRGKGPDARELADQYFFETLVRIHRRGEGEPFTGLKSEPVEPIIALADKALETGSIDTMAQQMATHLKEGLKERFAKALAAKTDADKTVEAGREYVEAYVRYLHYVEAIHAAIISRMEHHGDTSAGAHSGHIH